MIVVSTSINLEFLLNIFSAPHTLLAMGKVDPLHPDLMVDPLGILRPHTKLTHQLPLVIIFSHKRKRDAKNLERQTSNFLEWHNLTVTIAG